VFFYKLNKRGETLKMINQILTFIGAILTTFWGVAHLFPTKSVVKGFGDISLDNKRIITMEWIIEGITLIFIGTLVITVTIIDPISVTSKIVYIFSVIGLFALAIVSVFMGFKIDFLPYKLSPFIFSASAILILLGALL